MARVRLATIVMFKLKLDFRLLKLRHAKSANGGKVMYLQKTSPITVTEVMLAILYELLNVTYEREGALFVVHLLMCPWSLCAVKLMDYQCTREIICLLYYMQL